MTDFVLQMEVRRLDGTRFVDDVRQLCRNIVARHRNRLLLRQLARRNVRILDDMGFDPAFIHAGVENSWDEIRPEQLLRRASWL